MIEIYEGIAIHCATSGQAKELFHYLNRLEYTWNTGGCLDWTRTYFDENISGGIYYFVGREHTITYNYGSYKGLEKYNIVECSEILSKDDSCDGINVKIETFSPRIKKMAIKCPNCEGWFRYMDIVTEPMWNKLSESQIPYMQCKCPRCKEKFGMKKPSIKRMENGEDTYRGCLREVRVWEEIE